MVLYSLLESSKFLVHSLGLGVTVSGLVFRVKGLGWLRLSLGGRSGKARELLRHTTGT